MQRLRRAPVIGTANFISLNVSRRPGCAHHNYERDLLWSHGYCSPGLLTPHGALEALNGWLLFGLTTAFLFAVIEKVLSSGDRSEHR